MLFCFINIYIHKKKKSKPGTNLFKRCSGLKNLQISLTESMPGTDLLQTNTLYLFALLRIHWRLVFGKVICCSTPRLWGYFIYFKFTSKFFFLMDVKWMFFRLVKEINRLIRREMSNIYLKFTIENQSSQNFDFLSFKSFAYMSAFGEL